MSDQQSPHSEMAPRRKMVPANYSDSDAAMAKWIMLGFAILAGGLILVMAVPRIMERLS